MRLIDADTIDDVVQDLNENHNSGITRNEYKRITAVLYEMPTIDAVPVVRCKDCKYYEQNDDDYEGEQGEDSWGVCENTGAGMMRCGYCSDGERKDDEHTD